MISLQPQIAQMLQDNRCAREGKELVSVCNFLLLQRFAWKYVFQGLDVDVLLWLLPSGRLSVSQVLDVYAAMACIEYLEPQNLHGDVQSLAWLRRVKKLQVPIELVCCEESVHHYKEKSKQMVTLIQWVMSPKIVISSLFLQVTCCLYICIIFIAW